MPFTLGPLVVLIVGAPTRLTSIEPIAAHAIAQGIGCFLGCAVGLPLAVIVLDAWTAWRTRKVDRRVARKVDARLRAIEREAARNRCRRCGHPRETHEDECDGCGAIIVDPRTSARTPCECEAFLARGGAK
jgi:hypothetical protein